MEIRRTFKVISFLLFYLFTFSPITAQTARQVLDKTAAVLTAKQGAQASFTIKGQQLSTSGTIAIKGRKFHVTTPQAIVWYDGKTQWTYLKKNDEVNIATPTAEEQQSINPYTFIYLYKNGYTSTMSKKGKNYEVRLKATETRKGGIQELVLTIDAKNSVPSQIRMRQKKDWVTITLSHFKQISLSDGLFRFNSKDFPNAEVIDLR